MKQVSVSIQIVIFSKKIKQKNSIVALEIRRRFTFREWYGWSIHSEKSGCSWVDYQFKHSISDSPFMRVVLVSMQKLIWTLVGLDSAYNIWEMDQFDDNATFIRLAKSINVDNLLRA